MAASASAGHHLAAAKEKLGPLKSGAAPHTSEITAKDNIGGGDAVNLKFKALRGLTSFTAIVVSFSFEKHAPYVVRQMRRHHCNTPAFTIDRSLITVM